MDTYHISGGNILSGSCVTSGAKNAVLPLLAASVMADGKCRINNCPELSDVYAMFGMLESLGCGIEFKAGTVDVCPQGVDRTFVPAELMRKLRSSIFLMGPMVAAHGEFTAGYPGGCAIGGRPVDMHIYAMRALGAEVDEADGMLRCRAGRLAGGNIVFPSVSVGATENAMMAAALSEGASTIKNAAREPEIVELQRFLNAMGADIEGAGTDTIAINGRRKLRGCEFSVMPDRIEAGTILTAAAASGGDVLLKNAPVDCMGNITEVLRRAGCRICEEEDSVYLRAPERLNPLGFLQTRPYPGFPTDMQSQMMALAALAGGSTVICENIFEKRFQVVPYLTDMGADIKVYGKYAEIRGVDKLRGTRVRACDLRGGAALVIAALCAQGESVIENICLIDRGYDKLDTILRALGADIRRIKEE